ncbi:MAG TPA: YcgN family cysteine cluster protein [Rhodospirillales bacterium]|jgi:hypothetical protein|nr:YcgN family cysteine cluster protein [Rhodospirillales bacterium]
MAGQPFWRLKPLSQMSAEEWESLCDGCAKCCLEKLENIDTGKIVYTNVACHLLNIDSCRCTDYVRRKHLVDDCERLTAKNISTLKWLPETCAYSLLANGQDLPWWHPLVCGDPEAVHRMGMSVRGRAVPGNTAGDLEDHIVNWPDQGDQP